MASVRSLASLAALFALVACGGGGGGGGGSPTPPAPAPTPTPAPAPAGSTLSVTLSGGASRGIDHLWVTVTGLAMHTDATRVYGDGDAGWVVQALAAPVTLDLADPSLSQGQVASLLKQTVSASGTFAQLRLLVASSDPAATLTSSASAKGLQFNDQVQYTDAGGAHVVPLEIANPQAGLRLLTPFNLGAGATTPLAIEWNANSLVRRASVAGADRFTLRNELQLYNQQLLTALGDGNLQIAGSIFDAISGQLDTTNFCTGASHAGCIHDVVASATSISVDRTFHAEARSVNVAADGSFLLYPLPSQSLYDVVIRGGNMETIVVHNVFVDPTGLLRSVPTALSSSATPLVPVLDTGERTVTITNALVPDGSRAFFGQTIAGTAGGNSGADIPYAIVSGAADPASGRVLSTLTLPAGPLHYASFDPTKDGGGTPPAFTAVTPVEGDGAWTTWSQGPLATGTSTMATLASGATTIAVPNALAYSGFNPGTLNVEVSGTTSNGADHAELIVSNDGGTVAVVDVSSQIAAHGGSTAVAVPCGSSASAPAAAVYGVALRTWVAASETTSARWARVGTPVDLSATTNASVNLVLP